MAQLIPSDDVERCLRACLEAQGYRLSPSRKNGETGVDLTAERGNDKHFIEVIGFREFPPARSRDFYEVFFRAVSGLVDGARSLVIALPQRFGKGLPTRAFHYGEAWKRMGNAFPELEIWLVNCEHPYSYERTSWNRWLLPDVTPANADDALY
jgi:hypothetical protein